MKRLSQYAASLAPPYALWDRHRHERIERQAVNDCSSSFGAYFFAEDSERDGAFPAVALGRASVSASSNLFNRLASRSESGSFTAYCSRSAVPMPVRMARK
jgi:hypothetical protein